MQHAESSRRREHGTPGWNQPFRFEQYTDGLTTAVQNPTAAQGKSLQCEFIIRSPPQ